MNSSNKNSNAIVSAIAMGQPSDWADLLQDFMTLETDVKCFISVYFHSATSSSCEQKEAELRLYRDALIQQVIILLL